MKTADDSTPLAIRESRPDDAAGVARVHVASWQTAYRDQLPDAFLNALDAREREAMWRRGVGHPDRPIFIAEDAGRIVGFCALVRSRDADADETVGEITAIYVDPGYWRRQCGTRLLYAAVARAAGVNFRALTLWVLETNRPARTFYEKHGFRPDGAAKTETMWGVTVREIRYRRPVSPQPEPSR